MFLSPASRAKRPVPTGLPPPATGTARLCGLAEPREDRARTGAGQRVRHASLA